MKEQWLDHMRNQLKDYTETPPEGLWEDIEKELFSEEEDSKLIIPLKKETKFAFISNGNIKKIAAAILSQPELLNQCSLSDVAKQLDVGEATFIRFCRTLGFHLLTLFLHPPFLSFRYGSFD